MAKANPFRFSTKYQDDETDLLYYGYRYYNASTGKWLNRDPGGEEQGANLLGFLSNDPVSAVDFLGLCNCCCCANDIKIENIQKTTGILGRFGHKFDTVMYLSYVQSSEKRDCKLMWFERTNQGYTQGMSKQQNVWYDMTQDPETASTFDGSWGKRKLPCHGTEAVRDTDEPVGSVYMPPRYLEFKIIVISGSGCPCPKQSVVITAKQTLDATKSPRQQDFVVPDPGPGLGGTKSPRQQAGVLRVQDL